MFKTAPFASSTFTVGGDGFPVGNRPVYSDAERAFAKALVSSGVPLSPSDNLEVTAAGGMALSVAPGLIIKNGGRGYLDTAKTITLTTSTSDRVIYIGIRMAAADAYIVGDNIAAYTTFVQATDCAVARINIPANATAITSGMITDLRGNMAYCPHVTDLRTQAEEAIAAFNENGIVQHASTHAAGGDDAIDIDACNGVQYVAQTLTSGEKSQVRTNIGAAETSVNNLSSTSTTAALSANQGKNLDNLKQSAMELLWTNSAPGTAFGAQTISLTLSSYDAVAIIFYPKIDMQYPQSPFIIGRGTTTYCPIPWGYTRVRRVQVTDSGVVFDGGGRQTTYGSVTVTANSDDVIPYRIYGIKHLYKV